MPASSAGRGRWCSRARAGACGSTTANARSSTRRDAFIAASLDEQAEYGLVADPAAAAARIETVPELADALAGVDWVQENLPETLDVKREVFALLDRHAPPEAVLASSTSAIPASQFTEALARPRALSRRASGESAASRSRRRAVRRAVDLACSHRAREARIRRRGTGARRRAQRKSTASSSTGCRARCWRKRCGSSARATFRPQDLDKTVRDGLGLALVVHGAARDDRVECARWHRGLLRAVRWLSIAGSPRRRRAPSVWDAEAPAASPPRWARRRRRARARMRARDGATAG